MHTFLHFVVSLQSRFYTLALVFVFDMNIYSPSLSTIYNMSGRVVSDIQTRAEGDSSYEFIGEVILKINVV